MKTYDLNTGITVINCNCKECKKEVVLKVKTEHWNNYQAGEFIQSSLTELSTDERELLLSGMCGKCWNKVVGEDYPNEDVPYKMN